MVARNREIPENAMISRERSGNHMGNLILNGSVLTAVLHTMEGPDGNNGKMALALLLLMGIDYLLGMAAAQRKKKWSAAAALDGLRRKLGTLCLAVTGLILDVVMPFLEEYILPPGLRIRSVFALLIAFFVLKEIYSIFRNAVKLGVPVPDWLRKMLGLEEEDENSRNGST